MDQQAFEFVLRRLEEDLGKLRRRWKREEGFIPWELRCKIARFLGRQEPSDEVEGPLDYTLSIRNGLCGPRTGLVSLNLWADIPGKLAMFECSPTTRTVEEGLREVWGQLRIELDQETADLADFPIEAALGELMQELVEIGVAMSPPEAEVKPEVGRRGPKISVQIDHGRGCLSFLEGAGVEITFYEVGRAFADVNQSDWNYLVVEVTSTTGELLTDLKSALSMAHERADNPKGEQAFWREVMEDRC